MQNSVLDDFWKNLNINPHFLSAGICNKVALKLEEYKEKTGANNKNLSHKLAVSPRTISKLLSGEHYMTIYLLSRIAILLDETIEVNFLKSKKLENESYTWIKNLKQGECVSVSERNFESDAKTTFFNLSTNEATEEYRKYLTKTLKVSIIKVGDFYKIHKRVI